MKKIFSIFLTVFLLSNALIYAAPAKRIISLSPSLTKNLQYLEAESSMVGRTSYCNTKRNITVVASAIKVNVEKVVSLKPDLVITTTLTPPQTIAALKKMGVNIVVFSSPKSFNEICDQFLHLGKLIGKEAKAKTVLAGVQKKVNALKAEKNTAKKIFIQLGANPLFAVIPNTFMADYITFAGSENIAGGMTSGTISREAVLQKNPDAIFIVTMGMLGIEEKKQWESFKNLSATRNKKIFIIDSDKACNHTPVTFVETLEEIIKLLK